eukprot:TRINITY_DN804_c0_g1_i2.p2 TRINITY_DN804_c0_g1~~TRINITY_DN804_c0_g1_i2.p2  ORF type:complete len:322 (+),score=80.17 TRINITY_DN804_c0_g1_i2:173-1138(+)
MVGDFDTLAVVFDTTTKLIKEIIRFHEIDHKNSKQEGRRLQDERAREHNNIEALLNNTQQLLSSPLLASPLPPHVTAEGATKQQQTTLDAGVLYRCFWKLTENPDNVFGLFEILEESEMDVLMSTCFKDLNLALDSLSNGEGGENGTLLLGTLNFLTNFTACVPGSHHLCRNLTKYSIVEAVIRVLSVVPLLAKNAALVIRDVHHLVHNLSSFCEPQLCVVDLIDRGVLDLMEKCFFFVPEGVDDTVIAVMVAITALITSCQHFAVPIKPKKQISQFLRGFMSRTPSIRPNIVSPECVKTWDEMEGRLMMLGRSIDPWPSS